MATNCRNQFAKGEFFGGFEKAKDFLNETTQQTKVTVNNRWKTVNTIDSTDKRMTVYSQRFLRTNTAKS